MVPAAGISAAEEDSPAFEIRNYTVEDGLPVDGVTDLLFDGDGYLWVSTFDGLARFDGLTFRALYEADTPGLSSGRILGLAQDPEGGIWTHAQLALPTRIRDGKATTYGPDRGFDAEYALSFLDDGRGELLVGTWNGVLRFDGERFVPLSPRVDIDARVLYRDDSGALWIGSRQGALVLRDGTARRLTVEEGLPSNGVFAFADGPGGSVWIGTDAGLAAVLEDGSLADPAPAIPRKRIPALRAAPDRRTVWVRSSDSIYRVHEGAVDRLGPAASEGAPDMMLDSHGAIWTDRNNVLQRNGVPVAELGSEIRSLAEGPEGGIWVATNRTGVYHLVPLDYQTLLEESSCYPVLAGRDGSVWIGTIVDGLFRYHDGNMERIPSPKSIQALYQDPDGTLWTGTPTGLFVRRDTEWDQVLWSDENPRVPVFAVTRDRDGALWVGSGSGVHRLTGKTWEHFLAQGSEVSEYVRAFMEDPHGALWMATKGGGVIRYRSGSFRRWTTREGLSSNDVRSLHLDSGGIVWVGTESHGLNRLQPGGDPEITVITKGDGLHDHVVNQILEDDHGRLWISSNRGVYWLLRSELEALARGEVTAVHSVRFTSRIETNGGVDPAGCRSADGRFWFPTVKGVLVMDPENVGDPPHPRVRIESVNVVNAHFDTGAGSLRIPDGRRGFDIAYSAPSYRSPENLRFRYRLVGLGQNWIEAGSRRVAYFTHVPPGTYRFEVTAGETPAAWSATPAVLQIVVPAHFWESAWFRGGVVLVMVALGIAAYRRRVTNIVKRQKELARLVSERTRELHHEKEMTEAAHREAEEALKTVEQQARRLEELDRAKSRFYANVSHEFRTPLTLTLGPLEDVLAGLRGDIPQEVRRDLETASRSSRRLLRLVNQILDLAKVEAGHLEAHRHAGDLVGLLRDVAQDFVPLAERRRLRFEVEAPPDPIWVRFDPGLLSQVFLNLLDNAFKFTPAHGTVHLEISTAGQDRVRVLVRDSGPGIPERELPHVFERFHQVDEAGARLRPGTGIGLALTRELVELHEGTIRVESRPGSGSTFDVELPRTEAPTAEEIPGSHDPGGRERYLKMVGPGVPSPAPIPETPREEDVPTVLVVEDNAELRQYLTRHLSSDYRVLEAADGAEGLDTIRRELPDLVVSDVLMPGLTGYEMVREVRKDPDITFVPIILLTARAAIGDTLEGLEAGAEDYVLKPFRVEELRARMAGVLASRCRLRERLAREAVPAPVVSGPASADRQFLDRVREAVETGYSDEDFTVQSLAEAVGVNRSHLFRRLKELGAPGPSDLIRETRLERAAVLLRARSGNVGEIAYGVGFRSLAHFSRAFRERYGVPPSRYADTPDSE